MTFDELNLPSTWTSPHLEEIGEIRYGLGQPPQQDDEGVPMIRATNVKRGRISERGLIRIKRSAIPVSRNPFLKAGDVVVVRSGAYTGDVAMVTEKWAGSVAGYDLVVSPGGSVDSAFCAFALLSSPVQLHFKGLSNRAAQPHLNRQQLQTTPIPLPPLPEQKKITHILSTVQRVIEAQERIIQTTTELKKALMHKLFTEGLRNEPQKQTEIGLVPESWEVVELVTLLHEPLRNGHSAKATTDEDGIRTLTLTAVTQRDFSIGNTKVTCADSHRVRDMWLKSGDIFIERANTADYVGLAALYEGEEDFAIFPDLLIRVRVDTSRILPKVLIEWLLAEPCRRYYRKNARSTAGNFPKIDQGTVEKTLIPVPTEAEQAELESSFRTLDEKLRQHTERTAALQDLFRTLLHELMTAKTRVHDIQFSTSDN